jgi:hypothetical protein
MCGTTRQAALKVLNTTAIGRPALVQRGRTRTLPMLTALGCGWAMQWRAASFVSLSSRGRTRTPTRTFEPSSIGAAANCLKSRALVAVESLQLTCAMEAGEVGDDRNVEMVGVRRASVSGGGVCVWLT